MLRPDLTLVILSDTHGMHDALDVPTGDVLIHAGDFTPHGTLQDTREFNRFLGTLPHRHKLVIAGNHEFCFEQSLPAARAEITHAQYLHDSYLEIEGWKFYGTPWTPWFMDFAFNIKSEEELGVHWANIPDDTDVVITHGPPYGILDDTVRGVPVGSKTLTERVHAIGPKFHVFGHIHESYGIHSEGKTQFVNASNCTIRYQPTNPPVVLTLSESA